MAGSSNTVESDLLRAVTHARMHVTSGRGLETVIHDLIVAKLGIVSQALSRVEHEMNEGRDAEQALQFVADKVDDENLRNFLTALRTPGESAIHRLNDLADNIQANWNFSIERYGARVAGLTQFAAVITLGTFVPTIARVVAEMQLQPGEKLLELSDAFEPVVYTGLSVVITLLVALLRVR